MSFNKKTTDPPGECGSAVRRPDIGLHIFRNLPTRGRRAIRSRNRVTARRTPHLLPRGALVGNASNPGRPPRTNGAHVFSTSPKCCASGIGAGFRRTYREAPITTEWRLSARLPVYLPRSVPPYQTCGKPPRPSGFVRFCPVSTTQNRGTRAVIRQKSDWNGHLGRHIIRRGIRGW